MTTQETSVYYRTIKVNGLEIFYREAGPKDAPVILLPHGFPTSSHMFRNLIPALADEYHLIAPDHPGFGNSSMPTVEEFEYTFDNLTNVIEQLTEQLGLTKYSLYAQDYGAPISYRLALRHPDRVQALAPVSPSGRRRMRRPIRPSPITMPSLPIPMPPLPA